MDQPIMERPLVNLSNIDNELKGNLETITEFNEMCKKVIPCIESIKYICNLYGHINISFRVYGDGEYLEFSGEDNLKLEKCGTAEYKIESKFKIV